MPAWEEPPGYPWWPAEYFLGEVVPKLFGLSRYRGDFVIEVSERAVTFWKPKGSHEDLPGEVISRYPRRQVFITRTERHRRSVGLTLSLPNAKECHVQVHPRGAEALARRLGPKT
ncbi:MAG: hypothetical protein ACRDKS_11845 [Actinomycetota bacterium]